MGIDKRYNDIGKYLNLITTCIDCQFARLREEWKKQYRDDMLQDLCVILMEYDKDKFQDAEENNHMNALITKIIQNNIYSKTSPFYKKYIRFNASSDDLDGIEEDI